MSYFGTKEWQMEARFGNVNGVEAKTFLGHSDDVGTALRYVHHEMSTADLDIVALYDTPSTVKVASTDNTNDVDTTGNGAQEVTIVGYDSSNNKQSEVILMNGQTEVTSSNTYKFVESCTVTSFGSTGKNAGDLWVGNGTFTAGVPATKYLSVELGTSVSRNGSGFVEAGKVFWPQQLLINVSDTTKAMNVQYETYDGSGFYEVFDIHFTGKADIILPVQSFGGFAAGTLIGVKADADSAGAIITTAVAGVLRDV